MVGENASSAVRLAIFSNRKMRPGQIGPGPKLDGCRAGRAQRIKERQMDRGNARRRDRTTVVRPTTVVRKYSNREAAESFAQAARGYTPRQLADAAHSTIECAKFWLEARRAPNSANLLMMAQTLPFVVDWIAQERDGGNRAAQSGSSDGVIVALRVMAEADTAQGLLARQILAGLGHQRGEIS
jgi:hypothetical protein